MRTDKRKEVRVRELRFAWRDGVCNLCDNRIRRRLVRYSESFRAVLTFGAG